MKAQKMRVRISLSTFYQKESMFLNTTYVQITPVILAMGLQLFNLCMRRNLVAIVKEYVYKLRIRNVELRIMFENKDDYDSDDDIPFNPDDFFE